MPDAAKLELVIGPAGYGKSAVALAEYRRILANGPVLQRRRALWLAPTHAAVNTVRDALAARATDSLLEPGVRTFAAFAAEVVWDAGLRVHVVSSLERRRIVRRVIADAGRDGQLSYFARVAESAGLVNLVDEAIADLKRRDISAEDYQRASRGALPRQREIANLYARYEQTLAVAKLLDAEGLFRAARDGIREASEVGTGIELIVVDGFTDFTTAQLEILGVLSQRARRVLVTLLGNDEHAPPRNDLFAKPRATSDSLAKLIGESTTIPRVHPTTSSAPAALIHLEANLFRSYSDIEEFKAAENSLDSVKIIGASGVQAELQEVGRRVKRLLVEGVPPAEIVVAFRALNDAADRLRGVFDDFGVPAHFDAPRRLTASPLVRTLQALLRLHAEDWPYRRLLQVIGDQSLTTLDAVEQTPRQWPQNDSSQRPMPARAATEYCIRHAQLPLGRRDLLESIALRSSDGSGLGAVDSGVASQANQVLSSLAASLDELPNSGDLEAWITAAQRLACGLGLLHASDHPEWAALVRGLRAVQRIDRTTGAAAEQLSAAKFADLVNQVAGEMSAPDHRDDTGRVRVLSAEAARFVRPRHLFIGGLSEQAFSAARRNRDNEAAAEPEAATRSAAGREPHPSGEVSGQANPDPLSDEMLLFYQLVTRPTESLTLSYPALDAKAQPMPPSPFVIEVERAFNGKLTTYLQPLKYDSQLAGEPLSKGDLRRHAVARAEERERNLLAALVRSPRFRDLGQSLLDGIEIVASRGDRRKFGVYEGLFLSDAVQAVLERKFGPDFLWSPSYLETYAACPFSFYAERVLRLQPLPELALESDLARRGSVLHDVLARLYAQLNAAAEEGGPRPTPEAVAEQFQQTLDTIVGARRGRGLDGALREIERRQIAAWAKKFAEQHQEYSSAWNHLDAPLVPRYFEARFGPKNRYSESADDASLSTDKPFEVAIGDERVRFTGQIDRIDVGRVGDTLVFNVVDYKTSARATVRHEHIEAGTQIQLPLYAMAVAELLLADKQAAALTAGYWSVRGKGFGLSSRSGGPLTIGEVRDGKVQMAAGWSELRESLLARIGEIVGGIRRGHFPVYNDDKNCTQFCPYSTCCRIAHVRSLEKVWPQSSPSLEGRG